MTEVTGGGHLSDGEILSDVDKKREKRKRKRTFSHSFSPHNIQTCHSLLFLLPFSVSEAYIHQCWSG